MTGGAAISGNESAEATLASLRGSGVLRTLRGSAGGFAVAYAAHPPGLAGASAGKIAQTGRARRAPPLILVRLGSTDGDVSFVPYVNRTVARTPRSGHVGSFATRQSS